MLTSDISLSQKKQGFLANLFDKASPETINGQCLESVIAIIEKETDKYNKAGLTQVSWWLD